MLTSMKLVVRSRCEVTDPVVRSCMRALRRATLHYIRGVISTVMGSRAGTPNAARISCCRNMKIRSRSRRTNN